MRTYCLACREHTQYWLKKITRANKVIRDKSRCAEYFSGKSRSMKQKHNKKSGQ